MTDYINSQRSSKIGGSVVNKVVGSVPYGKAATDEVINSQVDSSIEGNVTNTFARSPDSRIALDESNRTTPTGLLRHIWKAIPGLNGAAQLYDKVLHYFFTH